MSFRAVASGHMFSAGQRACEESRLTDDGTDARPAVQDDGGAGEAGGGALPDLTGIDLDALRSLDSPALSAVLDVLVRRTVEPTSVLCAFSNAS